VSCRIESVLKAQINPDHRAAFLHWLLLNLLTGLSGRYVLALRDTLIEEPLLYLCDNQSMLKAVNRWTGEGGKAMFVGART